MNANASKSKECDKSMMGKVADKVAENILSIMQYFGIRRLECRKFKSAEYEKILAEIETFDGVPDGVKACGMLVKDHLAKIMAAVGVVKAEMHPSAEESLAIKENYSKMFSDARETKSETPEKENKNGKRKSRKAKSGK